MNQKERAYLCKTPDNHCGGFGLTKTSTGMRVSKAQKAHGTRLEAFKCHKKYLISQGYEPVGQREFRPPDEGPILVLTKKSKYGCEITLSNEKNFVYPSKPHRGGHIF